jgi:hypothetical protein
MCGDGMKKIKENCIYYSFENNDCIFTPQFDDGRPYCSDKGLKYCDRYLTKKDFKRLDKKEKRRINEMVASVPFLRWLCDQS